MNPLVKIIAKLPHRGFNMRIDLLFKTNVTNVTSRMDLRRWKYSCLVSPQTVAVFEEALRLVPDLSLRVFLIWHYGESGLPL